MRLRDWIATLLEEMMVVVRRYLLVLDTDLLAQDENPGLEPIGDEDLVTAVDAESRSHHYDEVILGIGNREGGWLAHTLHTDPIHHLQRRWGTRLTVLTTGPGRNRAR